jgi:hypothetical protein
MPLVESALITDLAERNKVYWREILYRAHFGACTGLLRIREWLHGSERAMADGNVLMLAAGIRGLVEAAADTFDCFSDVAPTLADSHVIVRRAISGELAEQMALAPELESSLIHFAYARKLHAGEGPALHNAKTAKDCVAVLAESAPEISAVYASLCEYTHPAAPSIFRFAGTITHPDTLSFDPNFGAERIQELVALSRKIGQVSLVLAVAPLVMTLKVLNRFGVQEVTTLWADTISLSFSGMWLEIDKRLRDSRPPRIATDEEHGRLLSQLEAQYRPFGKKRGVSQ